MRKGRYILYYAAAFIAGNFFGGFFPLPAYAYLAVAFLSAFVAFFLRKIAVMLLTLFLLGAAGLQTWRVPYDRPEPAVVQMASTIKGKVSDYLGTIVDDGDELAVLQALAIGDKSGITPQLRTIYRDSGAMHLLALSGLHVGIIYAMIALMLSFLGGGFPMKVLRSALILLFLWMYALVSGLSPSISRAVIMITLYEVSGLLGSSKDGPSSIAASAFIITLFNPEAPRNIGFQLSYSAVIAIYTIYPHLNGLLETRSRLLGYVWGSVCIAISCQCTCGVLGWLYFGTFPRYFLVTNLLAVPVATVVMYMTVATLITSFVPQLNLLAASVLKMAIALLNSILELIAGL